MRHDLRRQTADNVQSDDDELLTDEEVSARYRGRISVGTLRNWRTLKIGPAYVKVGKAVLYRRAALKAWDEKNTVDCGAKS